MIQVGLRPNSAHCWEVMHHVADFVVEKVSVPGVSGIRDLHGFASRGMFLRMLMTSAFFTIGNVRQLIEIV